MRRRFVSTCAWYALICVGVLGGLRAAAGVVPLALQAGKSRVLTNDDIAKMLQAKLGDSVIVAHIKSSPCKFDTSTDALIKLKEAGVSDAVLAAMAAASAAPAPPAATATAPPPDPNDPLSPHPPGIYYLRQAASGRQMVVLQPAVSSGEKTGGLFKMAMTSGIAKMKMKLVVRGARASLRVAEKRPTFYFYFGEKANAFSSSSSLAATPSGPNDFALATMQKKKGERQLIVGQAGAFGASSGMRSKDTLPLDAQTIRPGVYKVQPHDELRPGEYGFFYAGGAELMGVTGGKVFDFGIDPTQ
jgi:hypothetical protein